MKKRLIQGLITCVVMSSLIVTPVMATPQDDVDTLEQQKSQAEAQAASVKDELVNLLVDYNALQRDIMTQEKRISDAESDYKGAEEKEKKQYEDMKLRIKYMYEEGDTTFFETIATAKSYTDLVNKAEYVQKVHDYDRDMLDEYIQTKNEVAALKTELEASQAEMKSMSDEMETQKANLESTLTEMKSQIADFDSQLAQAKEVAAAELAAATQQSEEIQAAASGADGHASTSQSKPASGKNGNVASKPNNNNSNSSSEPSNNNNSNSKPSNNNINSSKPSSNTNISSMPDNKNNGSSNPSNHTNSSSNPGNNTNSSSKPSNASFGQQIANKGCQYIGNPYVYGGNSLSNGIDCSGFIYAVHKQFGISAPRDSSSLRYGGKAVNYSDMLPGDVICYSGHVAIYIGNNTIVHASNSAPYPKGGIKTTSPANYRTVLAVRRYW